MKFIKILDEYENPFRLVPSNIVQSIRAFQANDLKKRAKALAHHFLYVNLGNALSGTPMFVEQTAIGGGVVQRHMADDEKILLKTVQAFQLPPEYAQSNDYFLEGLTEVVAKAGPQKGILVVLEMLPISDRFNNDDRESFLDVFRDAADYWAERSVAFRVFYSFR